MRILMISDIHANLPALLTLESEIEFADLTLVGGDLIGYYCDVNEVIAFVIRHGLTCVRGNHDHFLLHGVPDRVPPHVKWALAYAERVITPNHRAYLASLPLIWSQVVDGRRILLTHGSPWRPIDEYLYEDTDKRDALREFNMDVIAFGQTHRPWLDTTTRPMLINLGSLGQSRHRPGIVCCSVYDTVTNEVEQSERQYDFSGVVEKALAEGADAWIHRFMSEDK